MVWAEARRKEDVTGIVVSIEYTPIEAKRGRIEKCGGAGASGGKGGGEDERECGRITYVTRVTGRKIDYLPAVNNLIRRGFRRGENAGGAARRCKRRRVRKT